MVDVLNDGLAHMDDLDLTLGFDLDSCLDSVVEERARQASTAGDAGDGTAETIGSSQGIAVDACSAR